MDELITRTDAKLAYGATDKDLESLTPAKKYYSSRKKCEITLFSPTTIEEHLLKKYGSVEECRRLAEARCAKAKAATRERLFSAPAGWPAVGSLCGADRWAAIDTETTGLDPNHGCRCIEVAVVLVESGRVVEEWSSRINPGPSTTWEDGAKECNGIGPADVADAPSPITVWERFVELTEGLPLVAHNVTFDRRFIEAELALAGLQAKNGWHCTMGSRRQRLASMYYAHARRWINGAHTAIGDARAVAYLAPRVCR